MGFGPSLRGGCSQWGAKRRRAGLIREREERKREGARTEKHAHLVIALIIIALISGERLGPDSNGRQVLQGGTETASYKRMI